MSPEEFIKKWSAVELGERAAAQSHFIDLCHLLNEQTPTDADPAGDWYAFERGASKTTGARGWADVWKRNHFGWEYKRKGRDLDSALAQLKQYALALENPPLLIVCGLDQFRIQTNWTNSVSERHEFGLDELRDNKTRQKLKWAFNDPEKLKPGKTRQALTQDVASEFAELAHKLRSRGHASEAVAHFINRLVFCMFAEDVDLLPRKMFRRMLEESLARPSEFAALAGDLFRAMKDGGRVGFEHVEWFNGGLFNDDAALSLEKDEIALALRVAQRDWGEIDPSIFGTLFVRGLDPDKRSQLGAQYTDRDKILMLVKPLITEPWLAAWNEAKAAIEGALQQSRKVHKASQRAKLRRYAEGRYRSFLTSLRSFSVLDPACGSGNFLYLALLELKDLEHRVAIEAELLGLQREWPEIGPHVVRGVEINRYAADLARITVWIGEIQWMRRNGFDVSRNPILKPLENIERRDALLNDDRSEADWPAADIVIGNPPFLGDRKISPTLGKQYAVELRKAFEGRVPAGADLVCYWFDKARALIDEGKILRAGLVATNSIRGGLNRKILDRIGEEQQIFSAWSNEPWVLDGAAVRVSLVCFASREPTLAKRLDGVEVQQINSDLTVGALDLTKAVPLAENADRAFQGTISYGPFEISGEEARKLLAMPTNPNGRPNSDVVRPWVNGQDITKRGSDYWIIFFPDHLSEDEASLYEGPFKIVRDRVRPYRLSKDNADLKRHWWRLWRSRPELFSVARGLKQQIVTPRVSKHRIFVWRHVAVVPDSATVAVARDDDVTFGILHSRFHREWSLRLGTSLEDRPRYTPGSTFDTFPFPDGMTPRVPAAQFAKDPRAKRIAASAQLLNERRDRWLNPKELVDRTSERWPNLPERVTPKNAAAELELGKRTLTNLYNENPDWLVHRHQELDAAVAAAYDWPEDISDSEALERLLALNHERAAREASMAAGGKRKRVDPEELRRQPQIPLPIPGGRAKPRQPSLPISEPLLVPVSGRRRRRGGK